VIAVCLLMSLDLLNPVCVSIMEVGSKFYRRELSQFFVRLRKNMD
jgi:hypothetical protein